MSRVLVIVVGTILFLGNTQAYSKSGIAIEVPKIEVSEASLIARKKLEQAFSQEAKKMFSLEKWILRSLIWEASISQMKTSSTEGVYFWFWKVNFVYPLMSEWNVDVLVFQDGRASIEPPKDLILQKTLYIETDSNNSN